MSMQKLALSAVLAFAALSAAAPALAEDAGPILAGAPVLAGRGPDGYFSAPGYFAPGRAMTSGPAAPGQTPAYTSRAAPVEGPNPPKECYAKVKIQAQYSPAQVVTRYVWRLSAAPPGAPGPIWCLVPELTTSGPTLISPERFDWIRVNCDTAAAPQDQPQGVVQAAPMAPPAPVVDAEGRYDRRSLPAPVIAGPAAQPLYPAVGYPAPVYPTQAYPNQAYPSHGYPAPVYPVQAAPQPCCRGDARGNQTILDTGVMTWSGKSY